MGRAPMLDLHDVTLDRQGGRGPVRAVAGLSLAVRPGELVALMGPSGSGKTSITQLASGLTNPTSGRVRVAGQDMTRAARRRWARLRRETIGMVGQDLDLLEGLPVVENVALPLLLARWRPAEATAAAKRALHDVGLDDTADALPGELSFGERQRVSIARATIGERSLVLADEPTAMLDTLNAETVVGLLADEA